MAKTLMPVLKMSVLLLKVALATQGLGTVVPDVGSILPNNVGLGHQYLNAMEDELKGLAVEHDWEASFNSKLDSGLDEDDSEAVECIRQLVWEKESESHKGPVPPLWEPELTGLVKVTSKNSCSMWVHADSVAEYKERGTAALTMGVQTQEHPLYPHPLHHPVHPPITP
jgi:hypothetical protein